MFEWAVTLELPHAPRSPPCLYIDTCHPLIEGALGCSTSRTLPLVAFSLLTTFPGELTDSCKRRIPRTCSIGKVLDSGSDIIDDIPDSEEALRRGEYTVIRSLIRVLEGGVEGKRQVDKVIDKCSAMQNLREAIAAYRNSIQRQPDEKKRESALSFFVEYLERYYFLICFAVYIHTDSAALRLSPSKKSSFADWMRARPELYSILRRYSFYGSNLLSGVAKPTLKFVFPVTTLPSRILSVPTHNGTNAQ
eukprot:Gb_04879 [translate_table: standard]